MSCHQCLKQLNTQEKHESNSACCLCLCGGPLPSCCSTFPRMMHTVHSI